MRARWLIGLAAAAAVLVSVGGATLLLRGDQPTGDGTRATIAERATTTTTAGVAPAAGTSIAWERVALPDAAHLEAILAVADGFVAFGNSDQGLRGWASADGLSWEAIEVTGDLPPQAWLRDFAWTGDRIVAHGEGFGERPIQFVAWSPDGRTWASAELEFPAPRYDDPFITEFPQLERLAAGPTGAVAFGVVHADLNIDSLIAPHLPDDLDGIGMGVGVGGPGGGEVEVTDRDGNVIFQSTLADLGVPPETLAVFDGRPPTSHVAWWSPDLTTWERIDDAFGEDVYLQVVAAVESRFVVLGDGPDGQWAWASADGETWERTGTSLDRAGHLTRVVAAPGGLIAAGAGPAGPGMWRSADGITWTEISTGPAFADPDGTEFGFTNVAVGGAGYLALGEGYPEYPVPDVPPVTVEHDGKAITFTQAADSATTSVSDLATGEELITVVFRYDDPAPPAAIVEGPDTLTIVDPETGETIVAVPQQLVTAAFAAAFDEIDAPPEPEFVTPLMALWYSADGADWTRWTFEEALGTDGYPLAAAVGDDRLVLAIRPHPGVGAEPTEEQLGAPQPAHIFVGVVGGS